MCQKLVDERLAHRTVETASARCDDSQDRRLALSTMVALMSVNPQTFLKVARPIGMQVVDDCRTFVFDCLRQHALDRPQQSTGLLCFEMAGWCERMDARAK